MDEKEKITPEEDVPQEEQKEEQSELDELKEQIAQYKEATARAQAELINFRNRAAKDNERCTFQGLSRAIMALLPVLDSLDMALAHEGDIRSGVKMTQTMFIDALKSLQVQVLDPVGEEFSPINQEALGMVPVEDKDQDGKVVSVFQKGYIMADRVIRPARVHVGQFKGTKS